MKILVLSLLRIGDVIMAAPVLRGLRDKYPEAQIHLVVNSQFTGIGALLPYVDRVIPFERELLQKGLGDANIPIFESYKRLELLLESLNAEQFDCAINLTHNRLSAWMMSLIDARIKTGLCFDPQGRVSFGSNWFRYLNHQVDAEGSEVFHFSDVFRFALELDWESESATESTLIETSNGRAEADQVLQALNSQNIIAVQPLTSDVKKNWGVHNFSSTIEFISKRYPQAEFVILGAPFERETLQPFVDELHAKKINAHLAILSLEGAFSLLKSSKLLLTGDTSIKHLACAAGTRVVEICVGSSDPFRTGAYRHGSVIIRSRETCSPCPHSKACYRERHACAERIPAEAVALISGEAFEGRLFQLRAVAEEFAEEIEVLRVEARVSGYWAAYSVLEPLTEESLSRWIDLTCRKLWLTGGDGRGEGVPRLGTEILRLSRLLRTIHPGTSSIEWRHLFADMERQIQVVEGRINGFKVGLEYLKGCYEDPRKMREFVRGLISLRERIRHSPLLKSFRVGLDNVIEDDVSPAFTRFRRIMDLVLEIERRTAIYLRLLRGLTGQFSSPQGKRGMEKS